MSVWLEYAQFAVDKMSIMPEGVEFPRDVFERSVVACGLHVGGSGLLWDAYLEFEKAMLQSLQVRERWREGGRGGEGGWEGEGGKEGESEGGEGELGLGARESKGGRARGREEENNASHRRICSWRILKMRV